MLATLARSVKRLFEADHGIPVHWVRKDDGAWLAGYFRSDAVKPETSRYSHHIEGLARKTNRLGPQPLWQGYAGNNRLGPDRMPDMVRTAPRMGDLYTQLVRARKPATVVEFGTAFGVSGMYFLAGLEENGGGELLTFDPNEVWASIARKNLAEISGRFHLTVGTFEDNIDRLLHPGQTIDFAFIDAIHTREFVLPQLDMVAARASRGALIILDDIHFSRDMQACWDEVSHDPRFCASASLGQRVGIVELAR